MLSSSQIAWGAGLLEGEGCFTLNGPSRITPMIGLGMTDEDVVTKFRDVFAPKSNIYRRKYVANKKTYFEIKVTGRKAVELMFTFFSHLGTRRRARIKEVLDIWRIPRHRGRKKVL